MRDTIENEYCCFWLEEGILFFICKSIPYLDLRIAHAMLASRLLWQDGRVLPIFCDTTEVHESSKAARDYLAKEGALWTKAIALYNPRYVASFSHAHYLIHHRPLTPYSIFSDRESALEFLRQYQHL